MNKNLNYTQKKEIQKSRRFNIIYNKYYYLVTNIAEGILCHEEALDVCQETFLTLYLRYNLSLEDEEIKALLIRITTTKSIDYYRKRNRESVYNTTWCNKILMEYGTSNNTLELDYLTKDFYLNVVEDIKKMRPEWAEILILHGLLQIPQNEVAKIMHIPITALRSRLNRARNYLKDIYSDEMNLLH